MSTSKKYFSKLNQVLINPFQLPSIRTSDQENEIYLSDQYQKNREEFQNYFSKKTENKDPLRKVKIQHKKFWQYQQIKTEDRLNSFLRKRIIETTDALQEKNDDNSQIKSTRNSKLQLNNSPDTSRHYDQHRLQISLPHLLPVIRYKQITLTSNNNAQVKKSPVCFTVRPSPSPIHSVGNNSTTEESNTLSKEFQNFQYSVKQVNQSSIIDLNSAVKMPQQKLQSKQLLVDLNLEKLIKMRNKKKKMLLEIYDNSLCDYYQEEKPTPHLNSDRNFVHKIEILQRERQIVEKKKISQSFIEPSKVIKLKERIAIAYQNLEKEKEKKTQVKKVEIVQTKSQNTNKLQEFNQRLETLAFHEVKGWQDEEEEFEQLGEYLKYSSKQGNK